jgi:hypothetical protein
LSFTVLVFVLRKVDHYSSWIVLEGCNLGGLDHYSGPDDSRVVLGALRLLGNRLDLDCVWIDAAQSTSRREMNPLSR